LEGAGVGDQCLASVYRPTVLWRLTPFQGLQPDVVKELELVAAGVGQLSFVASASQQARQAFGCFCNCGQVGLLSALQVR
jgi:hypothetical protein